MKRCLRALAAILIAAISLELSTNTYAADTSSFPQRKGRTLASFNRDNAIGWKWVTDQCAQDKDPVTIECAHAAILEATTECGVSAKFFRKGSETWKWIAFTLIVASAASTAVGASTTIANTKVWSTLGGTTGIGAATITANSNVTADENALANLRATLGNFRADIGAAEASKDYNKIYLIASAYGSECAAIANSSTGTTAPTQPTQPSKPGAPIIGEVRPGHSQASVAFTAPLSDGGAVITSYTVVASPGGATATGISSPIVVTGLTNGTTYTFVVTATNSVGNGPASVASTPVTPN